MAYKIEFISMKTNGIKLINDKWRSVTGKAVDYLNQFSKGDIVDVKLEENGDVSYIGFAKEGEIAEATDATTNIIKDTLGDIIQLLEDLSSQIKRIDMRVQRMEEKMGIKDDTEFKRANE